MNVIAIARHGIGIAGTPPVALAIARGVVLDCARHADPASLLVQVAGPEREAAWVARLGRAVRHAPLPPGIAFAVRIGNGASPVAHVLVAEREPDLGERPGAVIRVGAEAIEIDRRDGTEPVPVVPRLVSLAQALEWSRAGWR